MMGRRRHPRRGRDTGTTLTELMVAMAAGSVVLAAAAAIFLPAMQNSARERQAGVNLAVANVASSTLQRQVRDATYVLPAAGSSSTGTTITMCTFARANSPSRTVVTWKYVKTAGLTMTAGAGGSATVFGDQFTFGKVVFDLSSKWQQVAKGDILDMRFITGDIADGTTAGTIGTTLQFSAAPRSAQITSTASCA
ncbi:hypothetical protein [Quadrisphaera setariae]|uniref:Prepilin-type N-terminal cleavage/methylation domain-containing protein n=1 Tax=Quadrisphaera setariae TaxID=2593304 RepID=A0A5C8ZHS0_9ACTN|nr:hypothetical protein [Quadrisphaera setariae]TXR57397.1 hypothetical protein FMM08_03860 [Quadrisphaera setariae]